MSRTQPITKPQARQRQRIAVSYLQVAEITLDDQSAEEMANVTVGIAVLAGIAASDAICGMRLGVTSRTESHAEAAALLAKAVPDSGNLARTLRKLIDLKTGAHYGVVHFNVDKTHSAVKWAKQLVDAAAAEIAR